MQAYKETEGKLNYELDFSFIKQLAERMSANKGKYPPYNWKKLDNVEDLKQAMYRHVTEIMLGNYKDDNRLYGHIEALALNCMFINYQLKTTQDAECINNGLLDKFKEARIKTGENHHKCEPTKLTDFQKEIARQWDKSVKAQLDRLTQHGRILDEPTLKIGDQFRYKKEELRYTLYDIDADSYYFQSKAIKRQVSKQELENSPDWTKL